MQLIQIAQTLKRIARAPMEELSLCPGLGARKVQKLHAAFNDPLDPAIGRRRQLTSDISPYLSSAPRPAAATTATAAPSEPFIDPEAPSSEM